jgi:hypothetical protein
MEACKNWTNYYVGPTICMEACKNSTNYYVGPPICMEACKNSTNYYVIQLFVINVLVIMFHLVRRTSNLFGGVQKLDKITNTICP